MAVSVINYMVRKVLHQLFALESTPTEPGKSGAFSFSVCKAMVNDLHYGKVPAKTPALSISLSPLVKNNK